MGWGEPFKPRQGDMGAGVLTTSERLTARAHHDRCARALGDAVAAHLVSPTTGNADAMHTALEAYTDARKVLGG